MWPKRDPGVTTGRPAAKENKNAIYKTEIRRLNHKLEQAQQKPEIIPVAWIIWIGKTMENHKRNIIFIGFLIFPFFASEKKI